MQAVALRKHQQEGNFPQWDGLLYVHGCLEWNVLILELGKEVW